MFIKRKQLVEFLVIFIFFTTIVGLSGWYYQQHYEGDLKQEVRNNLSAIAGMKASQIELWRQEVISEAQRIYYGSFLSLHVKEYLDRPVNRIVGRDLVSWMESIRKNEGYSSVSLFDSAGRVLFDVPENRSDPSSHRRTMAEEVSRGGEMITYDLHRGGESEAIHMDIGIPLYLDPEGSRVPVGVLLLSVDVGSLFRLLHSWPGETRTAETLLIKRDAGGIVFLNESRFEKGSALRYKMAADSGAIPGNFAADWSKEGVFEGTDYRNKPVIAAVKHIRNSPWLMVAKIDGEEAYAPLRRLTRIIVWLVIAPITLAGLTVMFLGLARQTGYYQAITGRKKAEDELRQTSEYLEKLFNHANAPIVVWDQDFKVTRFNRAFEHLSGYRAEEIIGRDLNILFPEGSRDETMRKIVCTLVGERWESVEIPIRRKNGEMRIALWNSANIYSEDGEIRLATIVQGQDITEHKQAQESLKESEEKYRAMIERSNDMIWTVDTGGNFSFINKRVEEVIGYAQDELLGKSFAPLIIEEDISNSLNAIKKTMEGEKKKFEARIRSKNGEIKVLSINTTSQLKKGIVVGTVCFGRDITERKAAEAALRESEKKFRLFYERAPFPYQSLDGEGRVLEVNNAWLDMMGYAKEEVIGRRFADFINVSCVGEQMDQMRRCIAEGGSHGTEHQAFTKEKKELRLVCSGRMEYDQQGHFRRAHCVLYNITERRLLEEQFRQSQKMEAVGRLAGGVAHDFNNLLTAINGYCELLLMKLDCDSPLHSYLEEIKKAADRATGLTTQLLAFSRKQMLEPKVVDLNDIVFGMGKMLRRLITEEIELVTNFAPSLGRVKVDPGQIEQVILNLAVNARDAMPDGGTLIIETSNQELDQAYAELHQGVQAGAYAMLALTDTGMGMDEETKSRLFEPFFTTKELGKGTGLGLSTVYGIVKQSGGHIYVYSELGKGTTFKIYLPVVAAAIDAVPESQQCKISPWGEETILVVEDDFHVRNLVREILGMNGYNVLEAAGGDEAEQILSENGCVAHLLLIDVVLPKMNGCQLAEKLCSICPGMKVLYMSGYTDSSVFIEGIVNRSAAFLQKPFTSTALAQKVRDVLDDGKRDI